MSRAEDILHQCGQWVCHSYNILKAIIIRIIFALHATIAIIRIVITQGDYWYLLNLCGVNFLLIELVITVVKRKGKEPKWFSPCFFLYICTMIPPIWFLEINRIDVKLGRARFNQTEGAELKSLLEQGLISHANLNDKTIKEWGIEESMKQSDIQEPMIVELSFMFVIILGRWILPKGNISHSALSQLLLVYLSLASDILDLLTLFSEREIYNSLPMVHIVLIVFSLSMCQFALNLTATRGRSFYAEFDEPEFEIYRNRQPRIAPQLLSSSTIRPLSTPKMKPRAASFCTAQQHVTVFENDHAEKHGNLTFAAVDPPPPSSAFPRPSISSLHSLPSSSTWKEQRSKYASRKSIAESVRFFVRKRSAKLLRSEVWSILVTVLLQDGPFFAVRLTAIFVYRVRSFFTYFFTFKNFLILILQSYRVVSICLEKDEQEQEFEEKLTTIRRMSMAASQLAIPLQRIFHD